MAKTKRFDVDIPLKDLFDYLSDKVTDAVLHSSWDMDEVKAIDWDCDGLGLTIYCECETAYNEPFNKAKIQNIFESKLPDTMKEMFKMRITERETDE